jgi:hypothetical protein
MTQQLQVDEAYKGPSFPVWTVFLSINSTAQLQNIKQPTQQQTKPNQTISLNNHNGDRQGEHLRLSLPTPSPPY